MGKRTLVECQACTAAEGKPRSHYSTTVCPLASRTGSTAGAAGGALYADPNADAPKPGTNPTEGLDPKRVWIVGRNLFVRCGYRSTLNSALRNTAGARWDENVRALRVGPKHRDLAISLIRESEAKRLETLRILEHGKHVKLPYKDVELRTEAKKAGAVWDPDARDWAFDDPDVAKQIAWKAEMSFAKLRAEKAQRQRAQEPTNDGSAGAKMATPQQLSYIRSMMQSGYWEAGDGLSVSGRPPTDKEIAGMTAAQASGLIELLKTGRDEFR